jgi:phytoene dehydrogenase-like protein
MTLQYDALIIGGGHNGLIAAAYLAKAGKKVAVLEKRHLVGGAAVTEEIYPGFKFTEFSYVVSLLRPEIIRDLELPKHGLTILPLPSTFTPLPNGDYLAAWDDHDQTRREIYRHSPQDADAFDEYSRQMARMGMAVKPILSMIPPDPTTFNPKDLFGLARLGGHAASLSEKDFYNLAKLMTMSAADLLDEWFETDALKGTKSASGIIGTFLGPRSPGTAYVLLHHYMGEIDGAFRAWGFAKGGTGGISNAIANAARALGAEVRLNAPVEQIILKNGRAVGVALEGGEEIYARYVVSSLDPKRTFLKLLDSRQLPSDFVEAIRRYRIRGSSGKVNLALSGLPNFTALPNIGANGHPLHRGAVSLSPSVDYIERAYDAAKYGRFSSKPYVDCIFPSVIDPDMAPPGQHVMSCFVQYAPYHLKGGWNDTQREAFGDAVVDAISEYAPNLKSLILHRQVLVPPDIERITGLTEGNIFSGELALHQLFFLRPAPGYTNYRTPIANFWQCGSGTHPGGGIMGASGRLAALELLRDWK